MAGQLERANRLSYLGSPEEAIEEYERVLTLSPTPRIAQEAQMGIGALKFARGDYRRARETFAQALRQARDWDLVKYGTYQLKEIDRRIARGAAGTDQLAQCGVRSLHEVLQLRGEPVPVEQVAALVDTRTGTASLAALETAAEELGLEAVGVRLSLEGLREAQKPLIVHLTPNHFVVVTAAEEGGVRILDRDEAPLLISEERFREQWSGVALLFPADGGAVADYARLSAAEMREIRGGHHLHGNNQGDPTSNPASPFDGGPSSPNPCGGAGLPNILVNLSNFNLLVQDTDFVYAGLGPAVRLQRTYNADDSEEGPFGRSWSFNYGVVVEEQANGSVSLRRESGKEEFFSLIGCSAGTCTYNPPIWIHDELIKHPDGTFELLVKRTRLIQRFDLGGKLAAIEDRNGNRVTLGYDGVGRLTTVTDAVGRVTTFSYGGNGKVSKVADPASREVTFAYDGAGNLVGTVDMAGNAVSYTYDANSYMASVTTPTGTWTITNVPYDEPAFGLVVESITDPLGHSTRYSTPGRVVVDFEDPNGIIWKYFPTGSGQLGSMTDPLGHSTKFQYNGRGDLTKVTDALGNETRFSWDSRGNLTRITDPLLNEVNLSYNGDDNLTQLIDALSNTYNYSYDAVGNVTQITDAAGGITLFTHDSRGQLTFLSDARGKTTAFTYDAQGNLATMTTPLGKQTLYSYDAIGRPTGITTPQGITRVFEWDGIDRPTKTTYPDGTEVNLTYGCCHLESVTGPNGTLSFTYDAAGRPLSYTDVWGNTLGYGLDPGGRLTNLAYPGGDMVRYIYDDADRLTNVIDWFLNTTSYRYDTLGQLIRSDLPNSSTAVRTYDSLKRLTTLTNVAPDGSIISHYRYNYDSLGNRTRAEIYESTIPSVLDAVVTYEYDADNRLLTGNGLIYDYDPDGHLTSKADEASTSNYEYNFDGRLIQKSIASGTTKYLYDGLGSWIATTSGSTEERKIVNPLPELSQLLMETDVSGNLIHSYVHGLGPISMTMGAGESLFYHYDGMGNVTGLTDSTGAQLDRYTYLPYGEVAQTTTELSGNLHQFGGRFGVVREGGLSYMRARFYSPEIGRFLSKDPAILLSELNSYSFAGNNPLRWTDPWGLWYVDINVTGGVIFGFTGGVLIGPSGVYPYAGGALTTPGMGGALTWSPGNISTGWNVGVQAQYAVAGQVGYAFGSGGGPFWEVGVGTPGASASGFYVFGSGAPTPCP